MRVTYVLGADMLYLAGTVSTPNDAWPLMRDAVANRSALRKFGEIIAAQGGEIRVSLTILISAGAALRAHPAPGDHGRAGQMESAAGMFRRRSRPMIRRQY